MNRKTQLFHILSLVITFVFGSISLLLYPLWADIRHFLSTEFPVMLAAAILGWACFAILVRMMDRKTFGRRWHIVLFAVSDAVMVGLLAYLLHELGTERSVLARQAMTVLPYGLWFGAILLFLWFLPRWPFLGTRLARMGLLTLLATSALAWTLLPLRVRLTSEPVVFLQEGGVVVAWGTNMRATGEVTYHLDGQPEQTASNQTDGLRNLGEQIVRVAIPLEDLPASMELTASSEGIRAIHPTSVIQAGEAHSEMVRVAFPAPGEAITFVSFSDMHEQVDVYEQLAGQIAWGEMDLAVYNGDFVNSTVNARQVGRCILELPTGEVELPRVLVRGNHETRNEAARLLDDWLLPAGGHWYQAFTLGNTFFIVLDSGEDKSDTHREYGGLVDFASYHLEQAGWLEDVLASPGFRQAQYRVLVHVPLSRAWPVTPEFEPVASLVRENTDIDLMINGHTHTAGIFLPEESGSPYPVVFSGGSEAETAAAVVAWMGRDGFGIKVIDSKGEIVEEYP